MNMRLIRFSVLGLISMSFCMGMGGGQGCQGGDPNPLPSSGLEGLWSLTRGKVVLNINWTVAGGGQTHSESNSGQLETVDPADYPQELASLVDQWNDGIDDLNASLDAAFPDSIVVTFPQYAVMKIYNPDDPTSNGTGAINSADEYFFLGDLAGTGGANDQGAGAILTAATIQGSFDIAALTTQGQLARALTIFLIGSNQAGASFTAQITVDYTGARTGDVPENVQTQIDADQTLGG
jgi:hypothetical protein